MPVVVTLCDRCLDGEGGECHTPGCALWMNRAPDVPIRSKVEPASASSSKDEGGGDAGFLFSGPATIDYAREPAPSASQQGTGERERQLIDQAVDREAHIANLAKRVRTRTRELDAVYAERNAVVLAFARLAQRLNWTVGRVVDPAEPEWPVLMIDTPSGQVSWHFRAAEMPADLAPYPGEWDGHSDAEKYARLASLPPALQEETGTRELLSKCVSFFDQFLSEHTSDQNSVLREEMWQDAAEVARAMRSELRRFLAAASPSGETGDGREGPSAAALSHLAERLRRSLERFGRHLSGCEVDAGAECRCGLTASLAAEPPAESCVEWLAHRQRMAEFYRREMGPGQRPPVREIPSDGTRS